jgi:FKBP-type peptidyl-prolyl cis-trans isomerase (trigger factor)
VLNITLLKKDIETTYQSVLRSIQADFDTKGFRKGKAPINLVKENISENKIIEEVLTNLISKKYSEEVEKNHLHPVIQPQIKVLNPPVTFGKDWEVEITGCELPTLILDPKYTESVKKINQSKDNENDKLTAIMDILVKSSKVDLPKILINADMENKLSQLVDQTQQAGITIEQYLKSRNQTLEKYQEILKTQIKNEWITNLCIDQIAKSNDIEISQKEVDELVTKNPQFSKNINLVYYLLTQQKVFDFLKKL